MNADGSGQRLLDTDLGPNVTDPDWSPDGSRIVLSAFGNIYSVPLTGGRSALLARDGTNPRWSPDGTRIAFTRGYTTIMLMNADGSGLYALVGMGDGNTSSRRFSWSPDGTRIAFHGQQDNGIDVINADGTGLTQLVPEGANIRSVPAWSPDGTRIAFLENGDICTAGLGGSDVARLTYTPVDPGGISTNPAWQPLPPGSQPAGDPGGSAGPPATFPRSTYWYPGCDRPDDEVTISVRGPARARLGSRVTYTTVLKRDAADQPHRGRRLLRLQGEGSAAAGGHSGALRLIRALSAEDRRRMRARHPLSRRDSNCARSPAAESRGDVRGHGDQGRRQLRSAGALREHPHPGCPPLKPASPRRRDGRTASRDGFRRRA
jgi:hypothetical protein